MTTEAPTTPFLSPAAASAIAGGLLVGVTIAVIGVAFLGPSLGAGFGADSIGLLFLIGGIFGVIAGAVAGADSDAHEPAKDTQARAKTAKPRMAAASVR